MSHPVRRLASDLAKIRIDYVNSTTTYYGFAAPNSSAADAVWMIKRETLDASNRTTQIDFADGNVQADNIWDNRATLTYS